MKCYQLCTVTLSLYPRNRKHTTARAAAEVSRFNSSAIERSAQRYTVIFFDDDENTSTYFHTLYAGLVFASLHNLSHSSSQAASSFASGPNLSVFKKYVKNSACANVTSAVFGSFWIPPSTVSCIQKYQIPFNTEGGHAACSTCIMGTPISFITAPPDT